jgi:hypothetical protein
MERVLVSFQYSQLFSSSEIKPIALSARFERYAWSVGRTLLGSESILLEGLYGNGNNIISYFKYYCMDQSSSSEGQLLWHTKVHYRVHKRQPLATVRSQLNPVHTSTVAEDSLQCFPPIYALFFQSGSYSSGFAIKTVYAFLISASLELLQY